MDDEKDKSLNENDTTNTELIKELQAFIQELKIQNEALKKSNENPVKNENLDKFIDIKLKEHEAEQEKIKKETLTPEQKKIADEKAKKEVEDAEKEKQDFIDTFSDIQLNLQNLNESSTETSTLNQSRILTTDDYYITSVFLQGFIAVSLIITFFVKGFNK